MMKQVTKIGFLLVVVGCLAQQGLTATLRSTKGNTLAKSLKGSQKNDEQLVQSQCDIPDWTAASASGGALRAPQNCGNGALTMPILTQLGGAQLEATESSGMAGSNSEQDTYEDRLCQQKACASSSSSGSESMAAYGCGCRKRTVCLQGDIVYQNQHSITESGEACQTSAGCDETTTTTTTSLQAAACPDLGCI